MSTTNGFATPLDMVGHEVSRYLKVSYGVLMRFGEPALLPRDSLSSLHHRVVITVPQGYPERVLARGLVEPGVLFHWMGKAWRSQICRGGVPDDRRRRRLIMDMGTEPEHMVAGLPVYAGLLCRVPDIVPIGSSFVNEVVGPMPCYALHFAGDWHITEESPFWAVEFARHRVEQGLGGGGGGGS